MRRPRMATMATHHPRRPGDGHPDGWSAVLALVREVGDRFELILSHRIVAEKPCVREASRARDCD
jgi:hypothetical protein